MGYNGSKYRGWQRQPKVISVQEVIEAALSKLFKEKIWCTGCGRTDAEVHASQYFLHFDAPREIDFDIVFRMNKTLPKDINIFDCFKVDERAHARYDATERTYNYFVHFYNDPFIDSFSTYHPNKNLDFEQMQKACSLFTKHNDFRVLCRTPDKQNHTRCTVKEAHLHISDNQERMRFEITSNRFLRGMIRMIMYRLLEIGAGKMTIEELDECLTKRESDEVFLSAAPQGLYLTKIQYPYFDIAPRTEFIKMLGYNIS